ncbi:hypothetical protein D3C80_2028590 [compost metagenome]
MEEKEQQTIVVDDPTETKTGSRQKVPGQATKKGQLTETKKQNLADWFFTNLADFFDQAQH